MRTIFGNLAIGKHDDTVEARNRRQTMRHHDARAACHQAAKCFLHQPFALAVERACSLVKHENRAVGQHGASDNDALALTARKLHAALARDGVEALRQLLDELKRICLASRFADFVHGRIGLAVGDVLGNRAVEQDRLLWHISYLAAQALLRAACDVLAIDQDAPLLDVREPQQQLRERGLARTAHAYETHALPGGDVQVEVLDALVAAGHGNRLEVDSGDIELPFGSTTRAIADIAMRSDLILSDGKLPFMIGGEHLVTLGEFRAVAKKYPDVHIIHFDAHSDTYSNGSAFDHGTMFYHAPNEGLIDPSKSVQIGIRTEYSEDDVFDVPADFNPCPAEGANADDGEGESLEDIFE